MRIVISVSMKISIFVTYFLTFVVNLIKLNFFLLKNMYFSEYGKVFSSTTVFLKTTIIKNIDDVRI